MPIVGSILVIPAKTGVIANLTIDLVGFRKNCTIPFPHADQSNCKLGISESPTYHPVETNLVSPGSITTFYGARKMYPSSVCRGFLASGCICWKSTLTVGSFGSGVGVGEGTGIGRGAGFGITVLM